MLSKYLLNHPCNPSWVSKLLKLNLVVLLTNATYEKHFKALKKPKTIKRYGISKSCESLIKNKHMQYTQQFHSEEKLMQRAIWSVTSFVILGLKLQSVVSETSSKNEKKFYLVGFLKLLPNLNLLI